MKRWMLIALLSTLGVAGYGIADNERLLARGEPMLLELAPVDPRSLMQGDYMALRFAIAQPILDTLHADRMRRPQPGQLRGLPDHLAVVRLDPMGRASFVRLHDGRALGDHERLLRFQVGKGPWQTDEIRISTDAWFFQEGHASRYASARYGEFKVDRDGRALLVGLRDAAGSELPRAP